MAKFKLSLSFRDEVTDGWTTLFLPTGDTINRVWDSRCPTQSKLTRKILTTRRCGSSVGSRTAQTAAAIITTRLLTIDRGWSSTGRNDNSSVSVSNVSTKIDVNTIFLQILHRQNSFAMKVEGAYYDDEVYNKLIKIHSVICIWSSAYISLINDTFARFLSLFI